jgi:(2Fe-2S) ferredoxin
LPIKRFLLPDLVPREGHEHLFAPFDALGGVVIPDALRTPPVFEHALDVARRSYEKPLADLRPGPLARLALDQLLSLCREHQIATTLVVMPEGELFRSWYAPSSWPNVDRFVNELARQHGVALVDAHEWCDEAGFLDSHHLLHAGARTFSGRLAESDWARSFHQLVARRTPIHSP